MNKYVVASIFFVLVSPALAQDTAAVFAALDANHDGKISQQEAQKNPIVAESFAQADKDHDGFLSKEEFDEAFGGSRQGH